MLAHNGTRDGAEPSQWSFPVHSRSNGLVCRVEGEQGSSWSCGVQCVEKDFAIDVAPSEDGSDAFAGDFLALFQDSGD